MNKHTAKTPSPLVREYMKLQMETNTAYMMAMMGASLGVRDLTVVALEDLKRLTPRLDEARTALALEEGIDEKELRRELAHAAAERVAR